MEVQEPPTNQTPSVMTPNEAPVQGSPQRLIDNNRVLRLGVIAAGVIMLILVVVLAIALHVSKSNQAMIDIEEHKYEATVSLENDGFLPATLTVKPDTEIFFENHTTNAEGEDGLPHQVVQSKAAKEQTADFSSGQIEAKSGYGYVFRKSGTYQFFNADDPSKTVTVTVK